MRAKVKHSGALPDGRLAWGRPGITALALAALTSIAASQGEPMRMYSQQVEVQFASPQDAVQATCTLAPVYGNREWAFSARWDDNNPNSLVMRERMAEHGLKGTFYLNQTDGKGRFGAQYARDLLVDGFSIGGHSQTHPKLAELAPNAVFYEVLANRIEREAQIDRPINSFAFPYGQYKSQDDPVALEATTRALRRSGYHHCVYIDFVNNNPHLAQGEFSTVLQVVPGDRKVNAAKFKERFDRIFKYKGAYAKASRCISLGVHPWQQGEEWDKLEVLFDELSGRADFWYCNLTQYAAYYRQQHFSRIENQPINEASATRRYVLHRPDPTELGDGVPLTWVINGGGVRAVRVDGGPVEFDQGDGTVVVNLPHSPSRALPQKIAHIELPAGAAQVADPQECDEFPGAGFLLRPNPDDGVLTLSCRTGDECELGDVRIRFRLPLQYETGIIDRHLRGVSAESRETVRVELPPRRREAVWSGAPHYYVAEVDFSGSSGPGRIFVTYCVD